MINYHDVPVSMPCRSYISEWIAGSLNEAAAFEFLDDESRSAVAGAESFWDYSMTTHLRTTIAFLYTGDGIDFNGDSITPGLDGGDEIEQHVHMLTVQIMQRHVDQLQIMWKLQRPNALFGQS